MFKSQLVQELVNQIHKEEVKSVFKINISKRKKKGVVALESWLRLATGVLKTAETRSTN